MIADASLSSAFDDLADLFLGGGMGGSNDSTAGAQGTSGDPAPFPLPPGVHDAAHQPAQAHAKPINVEGLILGHLPMMASLWASQYPRMAAAADNAPVAMIRLDGGSARVELFHPPLASSNSRLIGSVSSMRSPPAREQALSTPPHRPSPDLAGAISRAAQVASRIIIYSSISADELLFARSTTIRAMAVLTGADDASAVGAYKAIKRLAAGEQSPTETAAPHALLFRIAVMGSEETRATSAFHRLADAAKSFLAVPLEYAGHCRQIAGGIPGTILFEGPSAMTTQAVLESLARPCSSDSPARPAQALLPAPLGEGARGSARADEGSSFGVQQAAQPRVLSLSLPSEPEGGASAREAGGSAKAPALTLPPIDLPNSDNLSTPFPIHSVEAAALGLTPPPTTTMLAPTTNGHPPAHPEPTTASSPTTLPGLTPLSIRCPFDRTPILAIDASGAPQVITTAAAGHSAEATQQLLSVAAWLWTSRELLSMVCPTLRTDAQPVLHLITDHPTDVKRLIDSDLRLHVRIPPVPQTNTLALN